MKVQQLILRNFRNYDVLELSPAAGINILLGNNAQGKTNIIEALYYSALGRSHRTSSDEEMIRWEQDGGAIQVLFSRMGVEQELRIQFLPSKGKSCFHNGHKIKAKDIVGMFNAVLFAPEDLMLVKGAPVLRRRFLDGEISQASPYYYQQLLSYNRILGQRNHLLKKIRERKAKEELLDSWDPQLAKAAASIVGKRLEAVKKLAMLANLMHRKITANQENLQVQYQLSGIGEGDLSPAAYEKALLEGRRQDVFRGSTGVGPHRDDLTLLVNNVALRSFGSQGQQRTGALSLKLAELEYIKSETGEYPVLLLDDVMSELDESRREHLLAFIKDRIQTFISATDEAYFPKNFNSCYYQVVQGRVTKA
ncbi:DNA replication/repair protein RecF [Azotosporobacter soli]|uniref:DNA replication/repair protein RecF n=1 Tax=Azotosporobacter soli TaxID=3055040 RepID=UPI0031FEB429